MHHTESEKDKANQGGNLCNTPNKRLQVENTSDTIRKMHPIKQTKHGHRNFTEEEKE